MSLESPIPHRMPHRDGKLRLSPLPSYNNAVEEKHHLTTRVSGWTTTFFVPVPFRPAHRLKVVLPIPQRLWNVTSSRMSRRRTFAVLCFAFVAITWIGFALHKRFVDRDKNWPQPFTGKPPTLVFRRAELQKIWEWEIASGHYPSNRPSAFGFFYPSRSKLTHAFDA
jgi:WD repeat and SOF domain-containing protein 1